MLIKNFITLGFTYGKVKTKLWTCRRNLSVSGINLKPKTAILMLNMGGPQEIDHVHDYLLKIMTDRDMIQLPFQTFLGPFIAKRRTPDVQKKYSEIGGGSPILKWTQLQGKLLCQKLDEICPSTAPHKPYVAFRYANPLTENTLENIENDGIKRVVIFSQYPQYSCSTSGSSFNAIYSYFKKKNKMPKDVEWSVIDRWSTNSLLIKTFASNIKEELKHFPENIRNDVLILFSAHSLPLKVVSRGDSYPSEVGATVHLVMKELNHSNPYILAWQSKVGPVSWLGPFTDEAIKDYVKQGQKNFILVPIAFVNEHIETLHELDIEYCKELKEEVGVETIRRVSAPNDHPLFINALVDIVSNHLKSNQKISPKFLTTCPHCVNPKCTSSKQWYAQLCA
ncbi:gerrochelatase, putative [Pediculus humanus corporis]|uniref:Ferrochelatase n=1 Tax=Pediculus humanus subsp. corporis TaxID=121224 RepID=E0VYP4_PEDHC|nr:gerrochelatase, putative [Pediculus humanus corporis]EEB18500.1 gerrochelatase, putative [Pediculus humanus corporis]